MKIAIIGGGYTGLSAAYYLSQKGKDVTIFEKDKSLGGLAATFKGKNWDWPLEKYYHHVFASDAEILKLAEEVRCPFIFTKPKTSIYYAGKISHFDSPWDLLTFTHISIIARLRTGCTLLLLKLINNWKPLEKITAEMFIRKYSGDESWKTIWKLLFTAKFDREFGKIPASWFWARIKKRGRSFRYPYGSFAKLTATLVKKAKKRKAKFLLNKEVKLIKTHKNKLAIKTKNKYYYGFDKIICTLPTGLFVKIAPELPLAYAKKMIDFKGRGTLNLVLSLKRKFLSDGTYWLNINEKKFPFIGVIEQTNYMPISKYNNNYIIYLARYLPVDNPLFKADKKILMRKFLPYLKKINPEFNQNWINKAWLFKYGFAQPIVGLNYSKIIPSIETPIKNIYLANMQQVYPWDRQVNYAVELGKKVSEMVLNSS